MPFKICTGCQETGNEFTYVLFVDRWEEIPPMLEPRASPSVGTVNGKIYVFGGDQINEVS
jgi:hypothetical protein